MCRSPTIARLRAGPYFYAGYWRQSLAMTRLFIRTVVIAGYITIFLADALCQQPHAKRSPTAGEPAEPPVISRVPADNLVQFSGSLEQLAAKASPAVVQIQVTGFGPAEES